MDATIDCLAEFGWRGTSLPGVVRRAGVARGAQVYYFPTKAELLAATTDHLVKRLKIEFETAFEALPAERRTIEEALDLVWTMFQGPGWPAILELSIAARTDEVVGEIVAHMNEQIVDGALEIARRYFPTTLEWPVELQEVVVRGALSVCAGAALQFGGGAGSQGAGAPVLESLKVLFRSLFAGGLLVPLLAGQEADANAGLVAEVVTAVRASASSPPRRAARPTAPGR